MLRSGIRWQVGRVFAAGVMKDALVMLVADRENLGRVWIILGACKLRG